MLYQHTWKDVLNGSKTATSRIVKLGDTDTIKWTVALADYTSEVSFEASHIVEVKLPYRVASECEIMRVMNNGRTVYLVGQDYAVQPGRGQKSVARIRITGIERYDVRTITPERAAKEGFSDTLDFLSVWCRMHDDPHMLFSDPNGSELVWAIDETLSYWEETPRETVMEHMLNRPAAKYDAWFLTFELASEAK